jgi:hypothetical protein
MTCQNYGTRENLSKVSRQARESYTLLTGPPSGSVGLTHILTADPNVATFQEHLPRTLAALNY